MKFLLGVVLSVAILIFGGLKVAERKKGTSAVTEILDYISLIKTDVSFLSSDYDSLYEKGQKRNYKHILFNNGMINLTESCNQTTCNLFNDFTSRLGTTDREGQISLCGEYKGRFENLLKQRMEKDKEKIQVNTALSLLGAVCVLVVFSW